MCKRWPQEKLWLEALLAPFRSCSCKHQLGSFRQGGGGSGFLGHRVPGSANAGDTSPWLRADGATRPPVPSCPRPFWPEQGKGLLPAGLWNCPRKGLQGPARGLLELEVATGAGRGEETPSRTSTVIQGWRAVPGGDARRGEGGGCHEEAAEGAGSGETGAAPAFPKHGLLAGPAERATGRNRVGRKHPRRKSDNPLG